MTRGFSETMSELRRKKGASQRTAAADLGISQALHIAPCRPELQP